MIKKIKNTNKILNRSRINWSNIIFFVIIVLAFFLRFYNLSNVPPSASLDEASIGWNAYSIIKTGEDEYGNKFPLLLRAYDDWRPALYVYLVAPFVQIFNLNVFAVRLPSVILSVLTVVATYFLVKELFRQEVKSQSFDKLRTKVNPSADGQNSNNQNPRRSLEIGNWKLEIPIIAAALLAISPWHIYISRLGHEANAGLAFFIFGVLFFLKKKIPISFIFFVLSFASYQAEKIFLPIFLIGLFFIFRKELLAIKSQVIISAIIAFIILLPFFVETLQSNALIRFKATSIFNGSQERYESQAQLFARAVENNDFFGKIIYNRRLVPIQIFSESYISHFNPKWLFTNPSSDRHKVPNLGLLYLFDGPLILFGLLYLFSKQFNYKIRMLILFWILASPLPAAITTDAPHAMRAYTMLPMPQLLGAIGAMYVFNLLKNKIILLSVSAINLSIITLSVAYMFRQYFYVFPKEQSASFQYALSKAIPFVLDNNKSYDKIVFSNQDNLYQSYMFFLFYSKYDPHLYQKQGGTKSGGFAETHRFGKYEFRPIGWEKDNKEKKEMYIGNIYEFPENFPILKRINSLDEKEEIRIAVTSE